MSLCCSLCAKNKVSFKTVCQPCSKIKIHTENKDISRCLRCCFVFISVINTRISRSIQDYQTMGNRHPFLDRFLKCLVGGVVFSTEELLSPGFESGISGNDYPHLGTRSLKSGKSLIKSCKFV